MSRMDENELENRVVAQNVGETIDLFLQLLNAEVANLRQKVHQFGQKLRGFASAHFNKKEIYAQSLLKLASNSIEFEDMVKDDVWPEKTYTIPNRTLIDLRFVLLNDEEDGIISRLAIKNPKWTKMPEYTPIILKESNASQFQLWNRPMGSPCTMPEDDDERLSLPSTRATDWGTDKMNSVEAQLALLTKQMQHLLALQHSTAKTRSKSPLLGDLSSDDEGRGASLPSVMSSPLTTRKNINHSNKIAAIAPPSGIPPPPPPPPANIFKPIENKVNIREVKGDKSREIQRPPRPTAEELLKVQLRKVEARSPGGTPQARGLKRTYDGDDQDKLINALQNRFRAFNGPSSEHDESDNRDESWAEED